MNSIKISKILLLLGSLILISIIGLGLFLIVSVLANPRADKIKEKGLYVYRNAVTLPVSSRFSLDFTDIKDLNGTTIEYYSLKKWEAITALEFYSAEMGKRGWQPINEKVREYGGSERIGSSFRQGKQGFLVFVYYEVVGQKVNEKVKELKSDEVLLVCIHLPDRKVLF